ncbi:dimethylsulfonioproprionate lyase family protein [Pseudotabrizicola sp. 4114]|uniref:dimethylsulfonioproprionate lyase family protein n=1 Tax=Pseudotabrizicola sp. 4114 TaxID=2817731 RepID=UPI0028542DFA|nr:quercetin dioxygenase-like cupin family protein [Pseudorhodobacter sp. 4114]
MTRLAPIAAFLGALDDVLLRRGDYEGRHIAQKVLGAFQNHVGEASATPGKTDLSALSYLPPGLATARANADLCAVADAIAALAPQLHWRQSKSTDDTASAGFLEGHVNTLVLGAAGLEIQHRFAIGLSLVAPQVAYPMHSHPPEELYLLLSPGDFRHDGDGWLALGTGETFYNTPGILHSMRAGQMPLVAIWLMGDTA